MCEGNFQGRNVPISIKQVYAVWAVCRDDDRPSVRSFVPLAFSAWLNLASLYLQLFTATRPLCIGLLQSTLYTREQFLGIAGASAQWHRQAPRSVAPAGWHSGPGDGQLLEGRCAITAQKDCDLFNVLITSYSLYKSWMRLCLAIESQRNSVTARNYCQSFRLLTRV